jgi:sugar phosphate isomerase/epimerase
VRIGVDSYAYHRLLGEVRPGEVEPPLRFAGGVDDVLAECRALGVAGLSLETCFLGDATALDAPALLEAAGDLELVLAWGHPHGLAFGTDAGAIEDLLAWIEVAPRLAVRLVRLCAASPRYRGARPITEQLASTAAALAPVLAAAERLDLGLAIENHGDLTASELARLLETVGDKRLGVCLDTANALRVGDNPVEAARLLGPWVRMVHLKDCGPVEGTDPVTGPVSVPFGDGMVPLTAVLDELRSAGFAGLACVEVGQVGPRHPDERALVASGVRWLEEHLGEPHGTTLPISGDRRGA